MNLRPLILLLLASACSHRVITEAAPTPPETIQANSCVSLSSAYQTTYGSGTGGVGDCQGLDNLPTETVQIAADGMITLPLGCKTGSGFHYEGCQVFLDQTCDNQGETHDITITEEGKVSYSSDGSKGQGSVTITVSQGSMSCTETYTITIIRL